MTNKSLTYLLPIFNNHIKIKFLDKLLNTYIYSDEYDEPLIVISYDISVNNEFGFDIYERNLISNELFIECVENDDSFNYIFDFPEDNIDDYESFVIGKYSEISNKSKTSIIEFINNMNVSNEFRSDVKDVLNLGSKLRGRLEKELNVCIPEDWELSSIVDTESETFKIYKYDNES